jgi:hypothetical protein
MTQSTMTASRQDQGAHGAIDDKAHAADPQLRLSEPRRTVLTAVALTGAAAGAATASRCR